MFLRVVSRAFVSKCLIVMLAIVDGISSKVLVFGNTVNFHVLTPFSHELAFRHTELRKKTLEISIGRTLPWLYICEVYL